MMHWGWIVGAALLAGLVLAACRRDPGLGPQDPPHGSHGDAQVLRMLEGTVSGIETDGVFVCRDAESLQRFWAEHTRLQLPTPPAPEVNFEGLCVVAVFCGDRPSGGYGVTIEAVKPDGVDGMRVIARETKPEPGSAQVTMMTRPFELVAVPRFTGPVELEWVD